MGADHRDRLQGTGIGDGCRGSGDVGFHGVGQGVHPRGGGQPFRHTAHQFGIVDGENRGNVFVYDSHLDVALHIGDDAEARHFGGGTGGGIDGDQRQLGMLRAIHPLIVADIATIGRHEGDPLGAIMRRSAP